MTELDEALRLRRLLQREQRPLQKNDDYFEGEQPLKFVAPILEQELGYRVSPIVLNLGRYSTDVYENRLDIEGFRFAGRESSDDELWSVWQQNDGPYLAQQAHREGLALSRAYALVGEAEENSSVPTITAESPFDAIHEDDPRTHQVKHGIKTWTDSDRVQWMTYLGRGGWVSFRKDKRGWREDERQDDDVDMCRLVPLMNDPRSLGRRRTNRSDPRLGRSVFHDVIPIMDALNKIASDMMVSAEFHALPRRWATGLAEDDFVDEKTGEALNTFSMIAGRIWGVQNDKAAFGQFPEADLTNFHGTIKLLSQLAGQLLALPPHYVTFGGDQPASADAIRSAESQLVKRAERKQQVLSTRWEQVQRLVLLTLGYPDTDETKQIETQWRDPSTPTVAQKADAIVKLVSARDAYGRAVLPIEQAWEDLGYSAAQQSRFKDWTTAATVDPQLAAAMRDLNDVAGGV